MTTNFPTSLDSLVNPTATDDVSVVSHSGQHANANDAIEALEAKVGIDSSAVTTSLDYKLKSTSSIDPGHKHTPASVVSTVQTLTDAATIAWNVSSGVNGQVTLGANRAFGLPTNLVDGGEYSLILTQDSTGSRTITSWDAIFRFAAASAPTLTTTALYSDYLRFKYVNGFLGEIGRTLNLKLYDPPPPPPSLITSINQLEITIDVSATTQDATIAAIVTANSIIMFDGVVNATGDINSAGRGNGYVTMVNTTTIRAHRSTQDGSSQLKVRCTVIEFGSGVIVSKQTGTISTSTSNTATITSVNTTYACVIRTGSGGGTGGQAGNWGSQTAVTLTGATTVTGYASGAATTLIMAYQAVEFSPTYVNLVQSIDTLTSSTSNTTQGHTITSVVTANSMLIFNGSVTGSTGNWREAATRHSLTSSTNVDADRNNAAVINWRNCFAVIEFVSGVIDNKYTGNITLSAASSNTATITAVDLSKSVVLHSGQSTNRNNDQGLTELVGLKLNSTTQVLANKADADDATIVAYQVVEFV